MDLATRDKVIELLQSEINKTQDTVLDYLEEAKDVQNMLKLLIILVENISPRQRANYVI